MSELQGLPLFDPRPSGAVLMEQGVQQVSENEARLQEMVDCIFDVAARFVTFTADEAMAEMERRKIQPHHPNAIGAAFSKASHEKLIEPTGQYRNSARPSNHHRVLKVWRSAWRS